jgi:hypothetical protein
VFDEFDSEHRFSAEVEIRRARDRIRQPSLLPAEKTGSS